MNSPIRRSLFLDALYQVLDNMVFRILAIVIVMFVLPTLLVGFREDSILLAFYWRFDYPEWLRQIAPQLGGDVQSATINGLQSVFIDSLAGGLGMLFCVVATSFFVPRMLEKGYADTLFSKPVSRFALLMSRYVAGILFVALLAGVLVGGQFLGLTLVSGYSDPGFLISVVTLVWLFMMLHAVSLLCGVLTRSSIASVMMVVLFYTLAGGIHGSWRLKEDWRAERDDTAAHRTTPDSEAPAEELGATARAAIGALDVAHYVMPKTSDAELIAKLFRRQYESATRELVDDETGVSILAAPAGYAREPRSSLKLPEGVLWIAPHPSGGGEARWTLARQSLTESKSRSALARELEKQLGADPSCSDVARDRGYLGSSGFDRVTWSEQRGAERRARQRWFVAGDDWMLTLDHDAEAGWAAGESELRSSERFQRGLSIGGEVRRTGVPQDSHTRAFGWGAVWKHNAWFSILTTLAFITAVLAFTWWRLSRADF